MRSGPSAEVKHLDFAVMACMTQSVSFYYKWIFREDKLHHQGWTHKDGWKTTVNLIKIRRKIQQLDPITHTMYSGGVHVLKRVLTDVVEG